MAELVFDFKEFASRSQIINTILDAMSTAQREQFDVLMQSVHIPNKHHHNVAEVKETIEALTLPQTIKNDCIGVYTILVTAEASVHGCAVEEAHFHEVGSAEGIRNALAICTGIFVLNPAVIKATCVQVGKGSITCAHGVLDVPAPATRAILDTGIPVCDERLEGERCTPTSAALIKYFVQEFVEV